jgi:hypothetical protein
VILAHAFDQPQAFRLELSRSNHFGHRMIPNAYL